jgi:hypothetical protein
VPLPLDAIIESRSGHPTEHGTRGPRRPALPGRKPADPERWRDVR